MTLTKNLSDIKKWHGVYGMMDNLDKAPEYRHLFCPKKILMNDYAMTETTYNVTKRGESHERGNDNGNKAVSFFQAR